MFWIFYRLQCINVQHNETVSKLLNFGLFLLGVSTMTLRVLKLKYWRAGESTGKPDMLVTCS